MSLRIRVKRIYDAPADDDGFRVLVDRLWPRGVSNAKAKLDLWAQDLAPSAELRKWFNHDPRRWGEFKSRYFKELSACDEAVAALLKRVQRGPVTFVFASREERYNNAIALKEYLFSDAQPTPATNRGDHRD